MEKAVGATIFEDVLGGGVPGGDADAAGDDRVGLVADADAPMVAVEVHAPRADVVAFDGLRSMGGDSGNLHDGPLAQGAVKGDNAQNLPQKWKMATWIGVELGEEWGEYQDWRIEDWRIED